jgi:hypothetical protein
MPSDLIRGRVLVLQAQADWLMIEINEGECDDDV